MNKSNQKRLIIVLIVCAALLAVLLALNSIDFEGIDVKGIFGGTEESTAETYSFSEPDYEANIYENETYMAKNRMITYIDDPYSTVITENINEYGALGTFFLNYIKSLTDGDADAYNSFFTDMYYEEEKPAEDFTMQMVYDVEIEKLSEDVITEQAEYLGWTRYLFKLGYKIMSNDGTFRTDMPSDTAVPIVLEVLYDGGSYKINGVSRINYING